MDFTLNYYRVGTAMELPLSTGSTQLLTVATAVHWFRPFEQFYKEVRDWNDEILYVKAR